MNSYRTIVLGFVAALTLAGVNGLAQTMNAPPGTLAKADQNFLNDAIEGDLAEIHMGKLAQQKGSTQELKRFGQMPEQDHSQHLQKAKQTAQQMGLTASSQPNAKQKKAYDQLSKLSGAQFDRQFAQGASAITNRTSANSRNRQSPPDRLPILRSKRFRPCKSTCRPRNRYRSGELAVRACTTAGITLAADSFEIFAHGERIRLSSRFSSRMQVAM